MNRSSRGFALVLTLALVGLLVLAVFALSALVRVNAQVAGSSTAQMQARQNAQLALGLALSELQKAAGPDARVTGIAGITGIAPHAANTTRHWCGVWRSDGSFIGWLASGAQAGAPALMNGVTSIELLASGAVGAAAANSEHVIAGKLEIADATGARLGSYAWLVLDEGVKTSAYSPAPVGIAPVIFANAANAQSRLRDALATYASALPRVSSYEQLAMLPPPGAVLTPSTIQDNLHHATLTARWVVGNQLQTGYVNVNTNSAIVWRNLLQTYNTSPAAPTQLAAGTLSTRGTSLQNAVAGFSTAGKTVNGPFTQAVGVSALLASVFTSGSPTAAQIHGVLAPQLAVRSDTFRIRAYGEAVNPADATQIDAVAWCEAMVQRTPDPTPNGLGRRFEIVTFRWLGPGDL
jgi:hypothetical protein